MKGNGHEATEQLKHTSGEPIERTSYEPIFERDIMSAGKTIIDSFTVGVFPDMQSLVDACLYIGQLKAVGLTDRIEMALYKLNGSMAIDGRARDEAVQAHVGVFFPRHASEKDKKRLENMQFKNRREESETKEDGRNVK